MAWSIDCLSPHSARTAAAWSGIANSHSSWSKKHGRGGAFLSVERGAFLSVECGATTAQICYRVHHRLLRAHPITQGGAADEAVIVGPRQDVPASRREPPQQQALPQQQQAPVRPINISAKAS
jgi:hypothetical protein